MCMSLSEWFYISIHALRVEGDGAKFALLYRFNYISIHALRVEGDHAFLAWRRFRSDFYPRPPGGGRPMWPQKRDAAQNFYPRPPGGGRRELVEADV